MKFNAVVSQSLELLTRRDRRRLVLVTAAQMTTALLDVAGVALLGLVAALATTAVAQAPLPSSIQGVIERMPGGEASPLEAAVALSVVAGSLLVTKSILNVMLTRRALRFLARRQAGVSGGLIEALLLRPLAEVQHRRSQEVAFALTQGVNQATLGVLGQAMIFMAELSLLLVMAVGLLVLDTVVALFTVVFFALVAMLLQRLISVRAGRLGRVSSDAEVASTALVQESLASYREVTITGRRALYVRRVQDLRWTAAAVQADLSIMSLVPKYVFEIALIIGAGLLAYSQFLMKDAAAAMATIVVFLAAGSRIVPSILRLQAALLGIRVSSGMAGPTLEIAKELAYSPDSSLGHPTRATNAEALAQAVRAGYPDFTPTVELNDVTFAYSGNDVVVSGVDLFVPSGASVALVGPTGAGKSTLSDLLIAVLSPTRGTVKIGGLSPLEAIEKWPGAIGYVPQAVSIATGTVRENVALGMPTDLVDDDLVWSALQRSSLADFLEGSREGLDTVVGEHGVRLSGGQRQRLGIARALYTRPLLLLLDEATSALDAETERVIVDTIRNLEGQVTTVTVAHRLATVRHCDVVVYMEHGRIVCTGTFDEVVSRVPNFARQASLLGLA